MDAVGQKQERKQNQLKRSKRYVGRDDQGRCRPGGKYWAKEVGDERCHEVTGWWRSEHQIADPKTQEADEHSELAGKILRDPTYLGK